MKNVERIVVVALTREEAEEILTRCLQSPEQDNPVFDAGITRLARAIERGAESQPGLRLA